MSERQTDEQSNTSDLKTHMFLTLAVFCLILNLLIFAGADQIPHWTLIVSYPSFIAFGFWVGFRWRGLSVGKYLLLGCILGVVAFVLFEVGLALFYPWVLDQGSASSVYFDPFVRCGVAGALFFTGFAVLGNMVAVKKVTVNGAFVAAVVSLIGAVASLITAFKK